MKKIRKIAYRLLRRCVFLPKLRCLVGRLLLVVLTVAPLPAAQRPPQEAEGLAQAVLKSTLIIDTHADTPQMMLDENYDLADPAGPYMVSIPKMQGGRLGAVFFSIWVPVEYPKPEILRRTFDLIDVVHEQVARHPQALAFASTADDIERLHRQGRIAVLMGLEGGHMIENDLRLLNTYYRLGIRYLTLTHSGHTDWADSSSRKPRWNGLTEFGRQVVERMNRLGMMVDISHVSDKTFYDALAASKAPVIASHSACRALADHSRNLSDDMLRALARNGGVVHINFYSAFIDDTYREAQRRILSRENAEVAAVRQRAARKARRLSWPEERDIRARFEAELPTPDFTRIADHIDHAVKVAGVDHVGLGSDFDGIDSAPRGMEDASKLPNLVRELARRGYNQQDLEKILGGNLLRVMRQVETVARQMQAGK